MTLLLFTLGFILSGFIGHAIGLKQGSALGATILARFYVIKAGEIKHAMQSNDQIKVESITNELIDAMIAMAGGRK